MVSKEIQIKTVFMGNATSKGKIAEVNYTKVNFTGDISKIFNKICNSGSFQIGQRNKLLANNDSCFYLSLCSNNIFYLIVTDKNYSEYEAFKLIEFLHEKNIYTNLNESGELSKSELENLKNVIDDFEKVDTTGKTINAIDNDIKDIRDSMKSNLKEVLRTSEDARNLEAQSSTIKLDALEYQDNARELKKQTCIQNWKWTIIIIGIVAILLCVILIPILT